MKKNTIINVAVVNNTVNNDHTGKPIAIIGLCVLKNGKVGALLDTDKYYSINKLCVINGVVYLSKSSITGVVEPSMDMTTEEGIRAFNSTITPGCDYLHIEQVILFKTPSQLRRGE